jgi:hypothetical protein
MLLDKRVPQPRQAKSGWGEGLIPRGWFLWERFQGRI